MTTNAIENVAKIHCYFSCPSNVPLWYFKVKYLLK